MGVVFVFWSASDTKSQKPKPQLWMGVFSTFWSASDTESKNLSPNIRYGGVTTLAQNTSSFQEVSPPRQRHLVLMRCYLLTIQVEIVTIAVRSLLYIHISKNTKLQLWVGFVSTFWSASDTESKKPKSQHYIWWCHHLNTEHMQFLGVSPRQRHLVLMRCYLLTIQDGNDRIAVRSLLYIHN